MLKAVRTVVAAAASAALLIGATLPTANADGLHLMSPSNGQVWNKGCVAYYSMDPGSQAEYGSYIRKAHSYLSPYTGIDFVEVDAADPRATIRYTQVDDLSQYGQNVAGTGATDGSVQLLPVRKVTDMIGQSKIVLQNLITHETMHVFGLGHDDDSGSAKWDEIMNPVLKDWNVEFGDGDKTGMEHIRALNGCNASQFAKPIETDMPTPPPVKGWNSFPAKNVKAKIPTKAIYNASKFATVSPSVKRKVVYARSDGKVVYVKFADGWKPVPYVYNKSSNTLNYSEAQKINLGLRYDPLGGVPATVIG